MTLLTHGVMVNQALEAAELLAQKHIMAQVYKVNEMSDALAPAFAELRAALSGWCVVIEDNVQSGGLGEWVAAHRAERTDLINTGAEFQPHGSVPEVYHHCGLDAQSIYNYVMEHRKEGENSRG